MPTVRVTGLPVLTSLSDLWFRAAARLPFVCLSKRKEAKEKTPGLRVGAKRAEPTRRRVGPSRRSRDATAGVGMSPRRQLTARPAEGRSHSSGEDAGATAMLMPKGCGQNSRRFGDAQTGWPHRRTAPDTLRHCASRSLHTGPEYKPQVPALSERQRACLYSPPWAQRRAAEAERG